MSITCVVFITSQYRLKSLMSHIYKLLKIVLCNKECICTYVYLILIPKYKFLSMEKLIK